LSLSIMPSQKTRQKELNGTGGCGFHSLRQLKPLEPVQLLLDARL